MSDDPSGDLPNSDQFPVYGSQDADTLPPGFTAQAWSDLLKFSPYVAWGLKHKDTLFDVLEDAKAFREAVTVGLKMRVAARILNTAAPAADDFPLFVPANATMSVQYALDVQAETVAAGVDLGAILAALKILVPIIRWLLDGGNIDFGNP